MKRKLFKLGKETSALGMGCWAIGGEWTMYGSPCGWAQTDDKESIKALNTAYSNGIRLFDTASSYGLGHSEKLLGRSLKGKRHKCI